MDIEETMHTCPCGVVAWVRPSHLDGKPFISTFSSDQPIRVRVTKE
jgi:hypothetical protein